MTLCKLLCKSHYRELNQKKLLKFFRDNWSKGFVWYLNEGCVKKSVNEMPSSRCRYSLEHILQLNCWVPLRKTTFLSKQICKRCRKSSENKWNSWDNSQWKQGKVMCYSRNRPVEINILLGPPFGCPYELEHIMRCGKSNYPNCL